MLSYISARQAHVKPCSPVAVDLNVVVHHVARKNVGFVTLPATNEYVWSINFVFQYYQGCQPVSVILHLRVSWRIQCICETNLRHLTLER